MKFKLFKIMLIMLNKNNFVNLIILGSGKVNKCVNNNTKSKFCNEKLVLTFAINSNNVKYYTIM